MNGAVLKAESKPAEPSSAAASPRGEQDRPGPDLPGPDLPGPDLLDTMPWLPCSLSVEVPVVRFTIADLLNLREGSIVETACHHTSDLPLRVNRLLIGWTEFEAIGDRLAVRITEQA